MTRLNDETSSYIFSVRLSETTGWSVFKGAELVEGHFKTRKQARVAMRGLNANAGIKLIKQNRAAKAAVIERKPIKIVDRTQMADAFKFENNDCTVNALARVTGTFYAHMHRLLGAAGRKNGRGFHTYGLLGRGTLFAGKRFTHMDNKRQHLMTFINEHPTGVYLLRIHKHVLALLDGVVLDTARFNGRSILTDAWHVTTPDFMS